MYRVVFPNASFEKRFNKTIAKIPNPIRQSVLDKIELLALNPRPSEAAFFKRLNPPVEVFSMTAYYRLRINNYRILYDVDDTAKTVWILDLRKRNELTYK